MEFNRTPDDRFKNLLDYPFKPNYVDVDDTEGGKLRMHFVDEGPKDGQTVVMVHGNPTWSSIARHEGWVREALFEKIGVKHAHFILHDWGGIIGLRAIADYQDRVSSIIMSNTGFPVRNPDKPIKKMARKGAGFFFCERFSFGSA